MHASSKGTRKPVALRVRATRRRKSTNWQAVGFVIFLVLYLVIFPALLERW